MPATPRPALSTRSAEDQADRRSLWRVHAVELTAAALLGAGLLVGLGLWARFGQLLAFEALRTYCF